MGVKLSIFGGMKFRNMSEKVRCHWMKLQADIFTEPQNGSRNAGVELYYWKSIIESKYQDIKGPVAAPF
jgi:hypothetical protein